MKNITVFGREIIDQSAIDQLENCIEEGDIGVLTADAHKGYHHPIGGVTAYKDKISVSGVGYDIGCGNKAVRTNIFVQDVDTKKVMNEIYRRISFGMGRPNNEPVGHAVLDKIAHANFKPQRDMLQLAKNQLGTVGGGNHFVDLFVDEEMLLWIGVHFGSRGFGHKTASGFIAMSQGLEFTEHGKEGSMDSKPVLLDVNSDLGGDYIEAMSLAGEYAYAGRDVVVQKVLDILGAVATCEVHNHHNFAWREKHFGEFYTVVRKGATPAFPGQAGFIGSNMMYSSVVVEGVDSEMSQKSLYSTVHGAGRKLSRTQAAGKKRWVRDETGKKRPVIVGEGCINFNEVKSQMKDLGIELRGAGADEAPGCYKDLSDVLKHMGNTIKIIHTLAPIGIAMAGDEWDPYKD